jgi:hypothetical protein
VQEIALQSSVHHSLIASPTRHSTPLKLVVSKEQTTKTKNPRASFTQGNILSILESAISVEVVRRIRFRDVGGSYT